MNLRDLILDALAPKGRAGICVPGATLYGDSIMAGGMAGRLRALLPGMEILDRSVPGDTAFGCWRRFPYDTRLTQVVVLQQGTNDLGLGGSPVHALRKMAQHAIAEGRQVVLTGISRRIAADALVGPANLQIAALATELRLPFAAWETVPLDADDGLHPNSAMADALATRLAETLARL